MLELAAIEKKLKAAKDRLAIIYEQKGRTDTEVLAIGNEVDGLLNQYNLVVNKGLKLSS